MVFSPVQAGPRRRLARHSLAAWIHCLAGHLAKRRL